MMSIIVVIMLGVMLDYFENKVAMICNTRF